MNALMEKKPAPPGEPDEETRAKLAALDELEDMLRGKREELTARDGAPPAAEPDGDEAAPKGVEVEVHRVGAAPVHAEPDADEPEASAKPSAMAELVERLLKRDV